MLEEPAYLQQPSNVTYLTTKKASEKCEKSKTGKANEATRLATRCIVQKFGTSSKKLGGFLVTRSFRGKIRSKQREGGGLGWYRSVDQGIRSRWAWWLGAGSIVFIVFVVVFPKLPVFLFRSKSGHREAPATTRRSRHEILVRERRKGRRKTKRRLCKPPSRDVRLIRRPLGARPSIRNPLSSRPLFPDGFSRAFRRRDRIRGPTWWIANRSLGARWCWNTAERVFKIMRKRAVLCPLERITWREDERWRIPLKQRDPNELSNAVKPGFFARWVFLRKEIYSASPETGQLWFLYRSLRYCPGLSSLLVALRLFAALMRGSYSVWTLSIRARVIGELQLLRSWNFF